MPEPQGRLTKHRNPGIRELSSHAPLQSLRSDRRGHCQQSRGGVGPACSWRPRLLRLWFGDVLCCHQRCVLARTTSLAWLPVDCAQSGETGNGLLTSLYLTSHVAHSSVSSALCAPVVWRCCLPCVRVRGLLLCRVYPLIHLPVEGHLGHSHFWVVVQNIPVNMALGACGPHTSGCGYWSLWDTHLGVAFRACPLSTCAFPRSPQTPLPFWPH